MATHKPDAKARDQRCRPTAALVALLLLLGLASEASAQYTVLREWWAGVPGQSIEDLASHPGYPDNPTDSEYLTRFEGPTDWDDFYGSRLSGVLIAPETGDYTFWVASDDASELWLSADGDPGNWVGNAPIAGVVNWTGSREWDRESAQQSGPIPLEEDMEYYIRVVHNEGEGGDNVCVRWRLPSGVIEEPIPGSRVIRYVDDLPPTVDYTVPADGAIGMKLSTSMEIHFSEAMDPDNMLTAFSLLDSGSLPVAGTSSFYGRVLTFTPDASLAGLDEFIGTLDPTGLTDVAGNDLQAGVTFSFWTSDNDLPPTVDHTVPANGDFDADASAPIEIHFSEAMRDQNMLTAFLLFDSDTVPVAGTSSFSVSVLEFTPTADLVRGETYMGVLVANDLLDLGGDPLQSGMSFSFTTFIPVSRSAEGCLPAASGVGLGMILCVTAAAIGRRLKRT